MWKELLRKGIIVLAAGSFFASVLALAAPLGWPFEIIASFNVHLAVLAIGCVFLLVVIRSKLVILLLLTAAVQSSFALSVLSFGQAPVANLVEGEPLRIVSANVLYHSERYEETLAFVRAHDPDVFVVVEETQCWREYLTGELSSEYPYREHAEPSVEVRGASGVGLYSKIPLERIEVNVTAGDERPVVLAYASVGSERLLVAGVHPWTPETPSRFAKRSTQLIQVADVIAAQPYEAVMIGDFNMTPYSPVFADILDRGGMRRVATGWAASWPSYLGPLGIPIDHATVTRGIEEATLRVGRLEGSDHHPLILDIGIEGAL